MKRMIITLLTDFGTRDYFVGAMKGVILSINSEAKIIDITHEIPPQDIRAASFTMANYYRNFPPGTIHIGVVDPGVGSNRRAILVKTEDYYFVVPDNGLLSFVLAKEKNFQAFELSNEKFFYHPVSRTFHGRDIFAPVAAHLSKGIPANEFGEEITDIIQFQAAQPKIISETEVEGEIIFIDRFGNLITNLESEHLSRNFSVSVNKTIIENQFNYFSEAEKNEIFSILGSANLLEIAAFQDSAKNLLNVKIGDKIYVTKTQKSKPT